MGAMSHEARQGFRAKSRLAARTLDLRDPHPAATLERWREAAGLLRRLELAPTRIRSTVG